MTSDRNRRVETRLLSKKAGSLLATIAALLSNWHSYWIVQRRVLCSKKIAQLWLVKTISNLLPLTSHFNMAATRACGAAANTSENIMSLKKALSVASPLTLRIVAECPVTKARACDLILPHSAVSTPVFMPVGTQGTLKGITVDQLDALGCQICLGNTYHLGMRPVGSTIIIAFLILWCLNWL